jgi:anti-sigma B factor antagonist
MRAFRLIESDLSPGCRQIEVEGELDLAVVGRLREAIEGSAPSRRVVIDLGRCEFIDSTAIATIVAAQREFRAEGRKLALCGAGDQVERVLTTTGLSDDGLVFASLDEALAAEPDG